MIKDRKEYPATHSMSTSWFFVDKDDNVAIFDFQDNGPIPDDADDDYGIEDFCFCDTVVEKDGMKVLPYTDEQVLDFMDGCWEDNVSDDYYWSYEVFQIDLSKEKAFFDYLREARKKHEDEEWDKPFSPICLSRTLGLYLVDLDSYDYGEGFSNPHAKYLFDSGIVQRFAPCPSYYDSDVEWNAKNPAAIGKKKAKTIHCPFLLYVGQYDARLPHIRVSEPKQPVKLSQLPPKLREKCKRMNLRFLDTPVIQVSRECLSHSSVGTGDHVGYLTTEDGHEYIEVVMPNGELKFALNTYYYPVEAHELEHLPLIPSDEFIERLKSLEINKGFVSVKKYYDD